MPSDRTVVVALLVFVVFAGANAIGVKLVPRGGRLIGTRLFGVFGFGLRDPGELICAGRAYRCASSGSVSSGPNA